MISLTIYAYLLVVWSVQGQKGRPGRVGDARQGDEHAEEPHAVDLGPEAVPGQLDHLRDGGTKTFRQSYEE